MRVTASQFIDFSTEKRKDWLTHLSHDHNLSEAINVVSFHMDSIYSQACQDYKNGNFDDAHKLFQLLYFYDHYESKYCYGLGITRLGLKQYKLAIDAFSYGVYLFNHEPKFLFQIAVCYLHLGNWNDANDALKLAAKCYLSVLRKKLGFVQKLKREEFS